MDKNDNFIKNHSWIIILIAIILILVGPFIINVVFKLQISNKFFIAEWSAGEMLSYYGSILVGLATIYLSYVAITQTKYANKVNEKLLEIDQIDKKVYLRLNLENSKIETTDKNTKYLSLEFENITDNIMVESNIKGSKKLLIDTVWKKDEKDDGGSVVTILKSTVCGNIMADDKKICYSIGVEELSKAMLVSFETNTKSIYGLETTQYFNIILIEESFISYKTSV